jgi:hypothetical protein
MIPNFDDAPVKFTEFIQANKDIFDELITPLNISNGTPAASPESVPQDAKGQPLPINQLKGTPPTEECSVSNVHRFKKKGLLDVQRCNRNYIYQGYSFFINFNLSDDADVYNLIEELDEFNTGGKGEIKIQKLINAFNEWLHNSKVKQEFKTKFNKKFKQELSNKLEEFKEKGEPMRRTQERTSLLQEEIFGAPYVPENRTDSVIGKKYRTLKEDFNRRNLGGNLGGKKKNKTKKCRKSRRYMRSKK